MDWNQIIHDSIVNTIEGVTPIVVAMLPILAMALVGRILIKAIDKKPKRGRAGRGGSAKAKKTGDLCPRCGGKLVERNGKYGAFIGCSNYPKCHYTRDR